MLIRHLPPESATIRAMGGPRVAWTQEQELLASIYDSLRWQLWQGAGKASAPKPKPFPRPGRSGDRHRTTLSPDQMAARLVEQRARHRRR